MHEVLDQRPIGGKMKQTKQILLEILMELDFLDIHQLYNLEFEKYKMKFLLEEQFQVKEFHQFQSGQRYH